MEKYRETFKRGQFHLNIKEIKQLIKATEKKRKNKTGLRDKVIIKLLAYQGLRRFELAKIKIDEIDFDAGIIKILGKKNIFRISFIFSKELIKDLKNYIGERKGYLFPAISSLNKKSYICTTEINRIVARVGRTANLKNPTPNLKNINPHLLRHSCARILKDEGLSLETVQKVLGHLSFKSTMDTYGTKSVNQVSKELREKAGNLFK